MDRLGLAKMLELRGRIPEANEVVKKGIAIASALAAKPKTTSNTNKFFIPISPSSKQFFKVYAPYTSIHFSEITGSIACWQSEENTHLNTSR
jgi:hypothetical protein